jgi:hypothetical protein
MKIEILTKGGGAPQPPRASRIPSLRSGILGWLLALGTAGVAFASCSQPKPECQVALATAGYGFAVKYTLKSPAPAGCEDKVIPGDVVGMEFYHPMSTDGTTFDGSKTTIAVQAGQLGDIVYAHDPRPGDPNHKPYAIGAFTDPSPDANNYCMVPTFSQPAEQDFPAVPGSGGAGGGTGGEPALTMKYEWSNMKVYVTAAAQGTQFTADLRFTEDACVLEYKAVGMWPAIGCAKVDENGKPVTDAKGKVLPDDAYCNPCPNPDAGLDFGSGINPDFPTKCDPDLLYCVLMDGKDPTKLASDIPQIAAKSADCGAVQ